MTRKKGIRLTKTSFNSTIKPFLPICENYVIFSFKHVDFSNEKFIISDRESKYFVKLIERLKAVSSLTKEELVTNNSRSLRSHAIKWHETTEPTGFNCLDFQLQGCKPYQFEVSQNEHGRVHGFLVDNIFFVVWFDPEHSLYNRK